MHSWGRRTPDVAGLTGGHLLRATLAVVGICAPLAQSESAMELLTHLGVAYLQWLGTRVPRDPTPPEVRSPSLPCAASR